MEEREENGQQDNKLKLKGKIETEDQNRRLNQ